MRHAPAPAGREEKTMAKGRCLCGALNYELHGPFSAMMPPKAEVRSQSNAAL